MFSLRGILARHLKCGHFNWRPVYMQKANEDTWKVISNLKISVAVLFTGGLERDCHAHGVYPERSVRARSQ